MSYINNIRPRMYFIVITFVTAIIFNTISNDTDGFFTNVNPFFGTFLHYFATALDILVVVAFIAVMKSLFFDYKAVSIVNIYKTIEEKDDNGIALGLVAVAIAVVTLAMAIVAAPFLGQ